MSNIIALIVILGDNNDSERIVNSTRTAEIAAFITHIVDSIIWFWIKHTKNELNFYKCIQTVT